MYRTKQDIYATQIDTYRTFSVQKVFESWDPISGSPYDEYDDIIPFILCVLMQKNSDATSQQTRLIRIMEDFEASVSCFVSDEVRNSTAQKLLALDMENPSQNLNEHEVIDMEKLKRRREIIKSKSKNPPPKLEDFRDC